MADYDLIIIGSGAGGGTLAYKLKDSGMKILIIERGDYLPREKENWDPHALFLEERYNNAEKWYDKKGNPFTPGTHYYVGGNTKFYGAALLRLRERDFEEVQHFGGISPAWPLKYRDFQPYYLEAETLYSVHGLRGSDPIEPEESAPYPFPPVSHEPRVQEIVDNLKKKDIHVFHLPVGIRLREDNREKSSCIRCDTCDGFPCLVDAKADSHTTCIRAALQSPSVTLLTKTKALKLNKEGKRIVSVDVDSPDGPKTLTADRFVLSCGAINTAALLLRSQNLANQSDCVGRHYMCHNNSAIVALSKKRNPTKFQKTLGINDYYYGDGEDSHPLGHIQLLGKVKKEMLAGDSPPFTPNFALDELAEHAMGWWITSEDLPDPENRITISKEGKLNLLYTPNNLEAHDKLYAKLKEILSPDEQTHIFSNSLYLAKKIPLAGVAHQVGTCRFGEDPKSSVLDLNCKAHDLENLYVVDGSFFPSISGVNPALTIIANALRVGDHLKR